MIPYKNSNNVSKQTKSGFGMTFIALWMEFQLGDVRLLFWICWSLQPFLGGLPPQSWCCTFQSCVLFLTPPKMPLLIYWILSPLSRARSLSGYCRKPLSCKSPLLLVSGVGTIQRCSDRLLLALSSSTHGHGFSFLHLKTMCFFISFQPVFPLPSNKASQCSENVCIELRILHDPSGHIPGI